MAKKKLESSDVLQIALLLLVLSVVCAHEGWARAMGNGAVIEATVDSVVSGKSVRGTEYFLIHAHYAEPNGASVPVHLLNVEPAYGGRFGAGDAIRLYRARGWFDNAHDGLVIENELGERRSWAVALVVLSVLSLLGVLMSAAWIARNESRA